MLFLGDSDGARLFSLLPHQLSSLLFSCSVIMKLYKCPVDFSLSLYCVIATRHSNHQGSHHGQAAPRFVQTLQAGGGARWASGGECLASCWHSAGTGRHAFHTKDQSNVFTAMQCMHASSEKYY